MLDEKASGTPDWLVIRDQLVLKAVEEGDTDLLRRISALPGGFGSDTARRKAWLFLLHVHEESAAHESVVKARSSEEGDEIRHKDEEQVGRDTARAFVTYPTDIPRESKEALQADLYHLIVSVLRKRPRLGYFQIPEARTRRPSRSPRRRRRAETRDTSVDEAESSSSGVPSRSSSPRPARTAPPSGRDTPQWQELKRCAEAISLLRVRDAMGSGMEGMMGMLRLLKRVLRAADPSLARFAARISPVPTLPFFALSWILCLFSHDVDSLGPVQRMFDWLLARNPVSAVYLAVAILIAKKPQMLNLASKLGDEAREDPTLLHPLFARLPPLLADDPVDNSDVKGGSSKSVDAKSPRDKNRGDSGDDLNPYTPIPLSHILSIADDLLLRYPWDGPLIRGRETMGEGSVLCTYDTEGQEGALEEADGRIDSEVVRTDAPDSEDDEPELPARRMARKRQRMRMPVNRLGMTIALGVLVAGVGLAVYGGSWQGTLLDLHFKRLGSRARWWLSLLSARSGSGSYSLQAVWDGLSRRIASLIYV